MAVVLKTVKVVETFTQFRVGPDAPITVGDAVDGTISVAIGNNDRLQDICLSFEAGDWELLRRAYGPCETTVETSKPKAPHKSA